MNISIADKTKEHAVALISISQQFLLAAKTKQPADSFIDILRNISEKDLSSQLTSDDLKKAFWINLYNACTQILLTNDPAKYQNRSMFFSGKLIEIAGTKISLDDIEHGILRRSKIKWSLGYLDKIFPSAFEKLNRVDNVDYRIHFALNCGAASCPPIAFYDPLQLNRQLNLATKAYLHTDAKYDAANNSIALPAIMGWFRADFGGKRKMIALLKDMNVIPQDKNPSIHFDKYNWKLFLEKYKT